MERVMCSIKRNTKKVVLGYNENDTIRHEGGRGNNVNSG